jgi:hypothetical protein
MGAIDPRYPPVPRPITAENLSDDERAKLTKADFAQLGDPRPRACWTLSGRPLGPFHVVLLWFRGLARRVLRDAPDPADQPSVTIHKP